MWWALLYLAIILLGYACVEWWLRNENFEKIPGPKGIFLLANALDFIMNPVKLFYYFRHVANTYKDLCKLKMGPNKVVVLYNPEDVEVVLSSSKYNGKGFLYRFLKPWLQEGLLLSDGAKWQHRRKILTPTFHFNILKHFAVIIEENCRKLVDQLEQEVGKPETDISTFITDFTLNSLCETAMGIKLDGDESTFGTRYKNAIYTLGQTIVYRSQRVWTHPSWAFLLTSVGRQQTRILQLISAFRDTVINKRRSTGEFQYIDLENYDEDAYDKSFGKKRLAMLDLLLQAEKAGTIDAQGIGEEVDTFMFEGHDTTSAALQFAIMTLAYNTEVQEKVVEECNKIFGGSDRAVTLSDLSEMKYLECCIKESLRLYPPVHFIMRKLNQPLKLRNYDVPSGTECAILTYDLQRRADQFVDPFTFKPERFLEEPTWHPYSYIPFSAGPRNCIGQKFAMMEMKQVLCNIFRRFKVSAVTKPQNVVFITDFILRSNHHIYVKLEDRQ